MKNLIPVIMFLLVSTVSFSQKDKTSNQVKPQDTKVTPGASGVKRSLGYKFSSAIEDKDPGDGIFRYNNREVASVSYIFVDKNDIKGEDQTNWYRTWDDTTGATGRGQIALVELKGDNVNVFDITDVFINGNGYWKFPVKYVSGKLPENDSVYFYVFNRIAHRGGEGKEKVEEVEKVEKVAEAPVVEAAPEVPAPVPAAEVVSVVPAAEPVAEAAPVVPVAETAIETAPVVPVPEPVAETAPVVPVPEPVAETAPVVPVPEPVAETAPVVPVPEPVTETVPVVPAAEPVLEAAPVVPVAEPVVIVTEAPPVAEPVQPEKTEEDTSETQRILSKKTKVPEKPLDIAKPKIEQGTQKIPEKKPDEGTQVTETKPAETKPSQGTTVAQGPPRVTETRQPSQGTTIAQGPPRVTETKPEQGTQGTAVSQGTKTVPATQPVQRTRINEIPSVQSYTGASGRSLGKCYRGIIELGYALRVSEYGMNNFRFNFINGFNIRHTSIGLGIGVRKYFDKPSRHPDWHLVSSDVQIPVFLDIRTHFSSKTVTPYLGIGIGNSTGFDSDTTNNNPEGLYFHATGGVWFNLSERFAVFGGFAYELQRLKFANFSDEILYNKYTNSISLNIGIAF